MGKVPTKKTSAGRKQARPEFDQDAEWTEEYLNRFTVPNLKDVIQKLGIRVNGRLKADLIQAMIDYRSPTNEAPQTTRSKRKRDVAESDNEDKEEEERAAKQPRRGSRRAAAKTKYTELSSDEDEEDEEGEEQKAPPPHTPARRSTVSSSQAPPPRPHRPKRKSIARKVSPTPSRRGSLASRRSLSPELLVRDPSPPAPVKREASVAHEAVALQDGRVATEAVNGGDDAVAEAGVEELAAPENHIEPRPTVLMRPHEALDGEVAPVPENHIEPRPTVLMRPHEASDATLQPADVENDADSGDEMDAEEDESEEEYNRFFAERNMELMEGHLAMNHINATFLETRALHDEMAVDIELIATLRHAEGVQAALLKPEGREFPVKQFAELR